MKILNVRNSHEALSRALQLLDKEGIRRDSRNGPVLIGPSVTTIYSHPTEKVVFFPERDSNIFFLVAEALWMLAGRNDLAPVRRYVSTFGNFSDDGISLNGAYGFRWRKAFDRDQLSIIIRRLKENPDDRRCVLQMWDTRLDLDIKSVDVCCNLTATFQRNISGSLDMTVFCRSNDILWGAYFANAFHFGMLLEYVALGIGCLVGTYTQISVNWHGYLNTLDSVKNVRPDKMNFVESPYANGAFKIIPMTGTIEEVDNQIKELLYEADNGFTNEITIKNSWMQMTYNVLKAHHIYKNKGKFFALESLFEDSQGSDWEMAAGQWLMRRKDMSDIQSGNMEHP